MLGLLGVRRFPRQQQLASYSTDSASNQYSPVFSIAVTAALISRRASPALAAQSRRD
jgi:hypothetical protein